MFLQTPHPPKHGSLLNGGLGLFSNDLAAVPDSAIVPPVADVASSRKQLAIHQADVAELADALDSKSGIRKDVWVRPPPSAPL